MATSRWLNLITMEDYWRDWFERHPAGYLPSTEESEMLVLLREARAELIARLEASRSDE
jgi:hypothetical protein